MRNNSVKTPKYCVEIEYGNNDRVWCLRFHREFNDWELAASYSLLHFIQSRIPRGGGSDNLSWCLNGSGRFDVQSFYLKIRNATLTSFPWKPFGKQRFLKGWRSLCGQQLMVKSLLWIILGYEAEPW